MYKKFIIQLFLLNMLVGICWFSIKEAQLMLYAATPAFQLELEGRTEDETPKADYFLGMQKKAASGQRVVGYSVMEKEYKYQLADEDYE